MKTLTLTKPDDWHLHLRTGAVLSAVLPHTVQRFARAVVMPNLKPPVTTVSQALDYREEIINALSAPSEFTPLMTLYLTQTTTLATVRQAAQCEHVLGFKLYPAGATTNSEAGVNDIRGLYPVLEEMQKLDVPLLIHGEVNDERYDIFDRERLFIEHYLQDLSVQFPALRIVLEHVTTEEAVAFVEATPKQIAATITPQHLLFNRNAMLVGGIKPHFYCLPVLKREQHRQALLKSATSGNPKFFLGTDSAPHLTHLKEASCGCAGCFSAPLALELYAEAFEQANALDKLEGFASFYGADFYRLPRNQTQITLSKREWRVPDAYNVAGHTLTPLLAGQVINWHIEGAS